LILATISPWLPFEQTDYSYASRDFFFRVESLPLNVNSFNIILVTFLFSLKFSWVWFIEMPLDVCLEAFSVGIVSLDFWEPFLYCGILTTWFEEITSGS
jgi:hypothetical protein